MANYDSTGGMFQAPPEAVRAEKAGYPPPEHPGSGPSYNSQPHQTEQFGGYQPPQQQQQQQYHQPPAYSYNYPGYNQGQQTHYNPAFYGGNNPPPTGPVSTSHHSSNTVNTVVVQQQQPATLIVPPTPAKPDHLVWSILNCLFCNCLLGIIAIVFSVMARSSYDSGDDARGKSYGTTAKILNIVSLTLWLVAIVAGVIVVGVVVGGASRVSTGSKYSSYYSYYSSYYKCYASRASYYYYYDYWGDLDFYVYYYSYSYYC